MSDMEPVDFEQIVRKKIKGWYRTDELYQRAVERIVKQRDEIISLLKTVEKVDVGRLLEYLDKSGFYYRPSSDYKHHNFPGGLAEHALGTFRIVEKWNGLSAEERRKDELYKKKLADKKTGCDVLTEKMSHDDMVIAAICHDLCKAEHFYFEGRKIKEHTSDDELKRRHSELSARRLIANGIDSPECDEILLAVRNHMHLFSWSMTKWQKELRDKGRKSMLAIAVWAADKLDAGRHPG